MSFYLLPEKASFVKKYWKCDFVPPEQCFTNSPTMFCRVDGWWSDCGWISGTRFWQPFPGAFSVGSLTKPTGNGQNLMEGWKGIFIKIECVQTVKQSPWNINI